MDIRFLYTGIRVRNLERSLAFYRKALGMKEASRGRMAHGGVFVQLAGPGSGHRLELNWYPRDNPYYSPYASGEELDHIAFWCRDVRREFRRLVRAGAKVAIQPWEEAGYILAYVKDPDGIWIELLGKPANRRQ
ncbi:MAG: VOC family protein [Methanobacteriota archaeon]